LESGSGKASSPNFFHLAGHLQRELAVNRARDEKSPGRLPRFVLAEHGPLVDAIASTPHRKGNARGDVGIDDNTTVAAI
jgi:hypothetical protein